MVSNKLSRKYLVGGIVSLIGGLIALTVNLFLFLDQYPALKIGFKEANNMAGVKVVTWIFPAMSDVIMIAGTMLVIAAIGFFTKKSWATPISIIASVLGLLGAWMALVWPLMISYFPVYIPVFVTFLVVWSVLLLYVYKIDLKNFVLATLGGVAMVLCFMDGTAGVNKIVGTMFKFGSADPLFLVTQQLNWIAAAAWGLFTVGVIYRKKWALIMGYAGGILALIGSVPLAYTNSVETGEFSLFWLAPILSGLLLLVLLIKGDKHWLPKEKEIEG